VLGLGSWLTYKTAEVIIGLHSATGSRPHVLNVFIILNHTIHCTGKKDLKMGNN